jgi:AcrR family transcriptional regulator
MSRAKPKERADTRTAILGAARRLLEDRGYHGVGLDHIARAAGVSRQAVYLHFGSKAGLLLALVDWIDQTGPLPGLIRRVEEATTGLEALDRLMELHATYLPQILRSATVLESARRTDPDAAAAWADRMRRRYRAARSVVERLAREGMLAEGLTVPEAADLLWALASIQTCEQLIVARGWSQRRYEHHLKRVARRVLTTVGEGPDHQGDQSSDARQKHPRRSARNA